MRVAVTGADGFIGSHLCDLLVEAGYEVRAMVQYNSFNAWGWLDALSPQVKSSLDVRLVDIRDAYSAAEFLKGCNAVCHLAALIAIPYSFQAPQAYVDTNVTGTLNILQGARAHGLQRVIHTSTSEVYGTAQYVPIDEKHPLVGQSPYSASKIAADQLAYSFYASFEMPVTIIRPFNTFGPRQSARAVIPTIISQLAAGARTIQLGALSPTRDFTFVTDTAMGFIHALRHPANGQVINLGAGFEVSIGQLAYQIAEIMGVDASITEDPQRLRPSKAEVERLWSNNSLAQQMLHWSPVYAGEKGFQAGLKETIDWFTEPAHLKYYKTDQYTI